MAYVGMCKVAEELGYALLGLFGGAFLDEATGLAAGLSGVSPS